MKRQAYRMLVALGVALVGATGCSAAGSTQLTKDDGTGLDASFCQAWLDLGPTPSVNDAEGAVAWSEHAGRLLDATPPRHRPAVEQMHRTATAFVDLGERAGWTTEGFGALTPRQQEEMAAHADALGLFFTGPVAAHAFATCPGADDPAFQLSCIGHRWFLSSGRTEAAATPMAGTVVGGTVPPPPTADPMAVATAAMPLVAGAVEVRQREADGTLQITFLGEDGRSLQIEDHVHTADGWQRTSVAHCAMTP